MKYALSFVTLSMIVSTAALAGTAPPPPPPNEPNCQAVYNACLAGKYVYGDAKQGNGLYRDCIAPLLTGSAPPKAAPAGVTFPSGPQITQQAQTCHKNHPKWGVPH